MRIDDVTYKELKEFEAEYRQREKCNFTLREILLEKWRPKPDPFGVSAVLEKIFELSRKSSDGLLTYLDIWRELSRNESWKGNKPRRTVSHGLSRVLQYCVINNLPILTTLVVPSLGRKLTRQAILSIYNECLDLGVEVGPDPEAFIAREARRARMYVSGLPNAKRNVA